MGQCPHCKKEVSMGDIERLTAENKVQSERIVKLIDMIDDLRHGLNDIGCDPNNDCYEDCVESAKYLVANTLEKMKALKGE